MVFEYEHGHPFPLNTQDAPAGSGSTLEPNAMPGQGSQQTPVPMTGNTQDPPQASALSSASTVGAIPNGDDAKDDSDHEKAASNDDSSTDIEKQQPQKDSEKNDDEEEEKDPNLIDWDGPDDPENPMNFNAKRKWGMAITMGLMTFVVTFASSVLSAATRPIAMEYGVGQEVAILTIALFVLGFAFGPIVWGPLSELFGRKIPLFGGYFCFAIFLIPVAVAQNLYTILICRFFGGFFASAPLAVVGGALADFFGPVDRGVALSLFGAATFIGPTFGPILGGFITMSYLGWRWTQWINLIMAGLMGIIGFIVIPETFAPVLLQRKAKAIRYETRNWAIHAPADEKKVDLNEIMEKYIFRPFKMLTMEPILVLITIYMSIIYGIIYGFFEVFPISFQEQRGWNLGVGALPFLGVLVGVVCGCFIIAGITKSRFKHVLEDKGLVPEERLIPMMIGGAFLPAGLFWFGWTSSPNITPWPEIISTVPIGAGVMMIFLQGLNYIIDVYKMNANSAIAANTFFRSWVGAAFPMFITYVFHGLGVPWAMSLLGFVSAALFPVPILFYIYGKKIRQKSKYSPD